MIHRLGIVENPRKFDKRNFANAIGENSIDLVAPAIAKAVYDAVGARISELPLSAEKIYAALRRGGTKNHVYRKEKMTKPSLDEIQNAAR